MQWYTLILNKWPDLIVTFLGVLLGGIIAGWIARWQMRVQSNQDNHKTIEIVNTLINRCKIELRDNKNSLEQLQAILDKSQLPHSQHYEWILTLTNSFKRAAYDDLLKMGLNHNLPKKIDGELFNSYDMLDVLNYMVNVALAGLNFYEIYGGNQQDDLITPYKNIKTYTNTVHNHLEYSVKEIYKYASQLEA